MVEASQIADDPRLILPSEDTEAWSKIVTVLSRTLTSLSELDSILNEFATDLEQYKCTFFSTLPGTEDTKNFDFESFWKYGVPLMVELALEMPSLFKDTTLPLLLKGTRKAVTLTRRQCACLLSHSFFGTITAKSRIVSTEKWAFRAAQLFFLQAIPSALCLLNYFKQLGKLGIPEGCLVYKRCGFSKEIVPWRWEGNAANLVPVHFFDNASIEDSPAEIQADFANRFVGGGCLENDFHMEEVFVLCLFFLFFSR
jgi:hypothetical protein